MQPELAAEVYVHFIDSVLSRGAAYSVQCEGDLVAVHGTWFGAFPLWPDKESADFFISRHWPNLKRYRFTPRNLIARLPIIGLAGIPVGIGRAPLSEAIVVPAMVLYEDLHGEHAAQQALAADGRTRGDPESW
jgi:hypothetical protein